MKLLKRKKFRPGLPLTLVNFLVVLALFPSCDGNNDDLNPNQTIVRSDSSITTGRLIVEVFDNSGSSVENATVSLYSSQFDLINDYHLLRLFTSRNGRADFGFINTGNYYLVAQSPNLSSADTGAVQIQSQRTITRNMVLIP